MRHHPLLLLLLLFPLRMTAQHPGCGSDLFAPTAPAAERMAGLDEQVRPLARAARGTGFQVPVVFHVVHDNGPENVPDSILQRALDQVNLRYQNAAPYTDPTGHVVPVHFCPAGTDPFGGPTTGITRHTSAHTTTSLLTWEPLKGIARWDPYRYLNVWVVRSITDQNVDGYSSFPADAGTAWDGVVIEAQYLVDNYLLAHELGHYLGLYHTFQGYCWNYNCELDGDHVCDTPPDDSNWFTCGELRCATETQDTTGLSPFTGDVPELPNYMDYSGCATRSFSQGQVDRMTGFLQLARAALGTSYGCGAQPYGPPPVAAIAVDSSGCNGQVTFTNTTPGTDFAQWDLGNDGWDAVGPSWTAVFDTTGTYTLLAAVGGPQGGDTVLLTFHVRVAPTPAFPIAAGMEGVLVDPWNNLPTACPGDTLTISGEAGMLSYLWSTGETTPSITWPVTGPFHVSLSAMDSSGLVWNSCAYDTVNVHLPPTITCSPDDTVHCGDPITIQLPVPAHPVSYTWYRNGGVLMGYADILYTPSWTIGTDQYAVRLTDNVGCDLWSNTLAITTLPTVPPVITQVGNDLVLDHPLMNMNWYTADGTPLFTMDVPATLMDAPPGCYYVAGYDCGPVTSDTVCVTPLGLHAGVPSAAYAGPSPFTDELVLQAGALPVRFTLCAADGRELLRGSAAAHARQVLHVPGPAAGWYLLHLWNGDTRAPQVQRLLRLR